jgi:hypothetical protein
MPTQTLMENRCWCLDATIIWGVPSAQARILWKFVVLVSSASSVKRMLPLKRVLLVASAKTPPLHDGQEEWGCSHSRDVVRVEWLLMENSSDSWNTDTFSGCNSSHTASRMFVQPSQYANFSKSGPYLSSRFQDTCWRRLLLVSVSIISP